MPQGQLLPAVLPSCVGYRLPSAEARSSLLLTAMQASGRRAPWPIPWRSHAVRLWLRVQSRWLSRQEGGHAAASLLPLGPSGIYLCPAARVLWTMLSTCRLCLLLLGADWQWLGGRPALHAGARCLCYTDGLPCLAAGS